MTKASWNNIYTHYLFGERKKNNGFLMPNFNNVRISLMDDVIRYKIIMNLNGFNGLVNLHVGSYRFLFKRDSRNDSIENFLNKYLERKKEEISMIEDMYGDEGKKMIKNIKIFAKDTQVYIPGRDDDEELFVQDIDYIVNSRELKANNMFVPVDAKYYQKVDSSTDLKEFFQMIVYRKYSLGSSYNP